MLLLSLTFLGLVSSEHYLHLLDVYRKRVAIQPFYAFTQWHRLLYPIFLDLSSVFAYFFDFFWKNSGKFARWGTEGRIARFLVILNHDVLFLFLSCEREKEPKREDSLCKDRGVSLALRATRLTQPWLESTAVGGCHRCGANIVWKKTMAIGRHSKG